MAKSLLAGILDGLNVSGSASQPLTGEQKRKAALGIPIREAMSQGTPVIGGGFTYTGGQTPAPAPGGAPQHPFAEAEWIVNQPGRAAPETVTQAPTPQLTQPDGADPGAGDQPPQLQQRDAILPSLLPSGERMPLGMENTLMPSQVALARQGLPTDGTGVPQLGQQRAAPGLGVGPDRFLSGETQERNDESVERSKELVRLRKQAQAAEIGGLAPAQLQAEVAQQEAAEASTVRQAEMEKFREVLRDERASEYEKFQAELELSTLDPEQKRIAELKRFGLDPILDIGGAKTKPTQGADPPPERASGQTASATKEIPDVLKAADPKAFKGKVISAPDGTRYKSDGKNWEVV